MCDMSDMERVLAWLDTAWYHTVCRLPFLPCFGATVDVDDDVAYDVDVDVVVEHEGGGVVVHLDIDRSWHQTVCRLLSLSSQCFSNTAFELMFRKRIGRNCIHETYVGVDFERKDSRRRYSWFDPD